MGLRASNSSFHSCKEKEYQGCPLKNDSPAYLVVWNMKSAVGRNALWDLGRRMSLHWWDTSISMVLHISVCTVLNVAAYWIRTCSFNQLNSDVWFWAQFEWMCHERMSFALLLMYTFFAMPSKLDPWCPFIKWRLLWKKVVCCYFDEKIGNHLTSVFCHLICIHVW